MKLQQSDISVVYFIFLSLLLKCPISSIVTDQKCEGVYNALNRIVVWVQMKMFFDSKELNNNPSNVIDH